MAEVESYNEGLENLIPEERLIKVGRRKNSVKPYMLYPLSIRDFKKLENVVRKFMELIFGSFGKTSIKITNTLVNDFLPELLDLMSTSSFSPEDDITYDKIRERAEYFEINMTMPQIMYAIECIMDLNKVDDLQKKMEALLKNTVSQSQVVQKEKQALGMQPLKR